MDAEVAAWQDVGFRSPRAGFFLGDDAASCRLRNEALLQPRTGLPALVSSTATGLAGLASLPLELLHQVVGTLAESGDVRALLALRHASRATAVAVDSWADFATVAAFPRALAAAVRMSPHAPSLAALAACLQSTACASCLRQQQQQQAGLAPDSAPAHNDIPYGDFIYLLAPERVCYPCFRTRPEYMPLARPVDASSSLPTVPSTQLPRAEPLAADGTVVSLHVPAGRYGVLARLANAVELFDRRQMADLGGADGTDTANVAASTPSAVTAVASTNTTTVTATATAITTATTTATATTTPSTVPSAKSHGQTRLARTEPLRYAAVIPGPYWANDDDEHETQQQAQLDHGYACRACAQAATTATAAGWANPSLRYTRAGLKRHVQDPRLGGRVLRRRDPHADSSSSSSYVYEHDAPRQRLAQTVAPAHVAADFAQRYQEVTVEADGQVKAL